MKKLLILIILVLTWSCSSKSDADVCYIKENLVIRQSNESEGFTQGKFHKPMVAGKWLLESVEHPGNFMEMSTSDYGITSISIENWYSKKVGDTVYFDYLNKAHFFKINKN